jgi:hypothetical protein
VGLTSTPAAPGRSAPSAPQSQLVLNHAIATVAKAIDEKILALPGSRDRLLPAISYAIADYERAIAAVPGPIDVSASRHGKEPLVTAIFPAVDDITVGLGRSIAVRNSINWFVENRHERVFAIMGTRTRPGSAAQSLTDHTFRSLAATPHDARECLCEAAFTSLVNGFATHLKERQREWRILHAKQSEADARPLQAATPSTGPSPQQLAVFERHLNPAGPELSAEDSLEALIEWLHAPEGHLRVGIAEGQPAARLNLLPGDGSLTLPLMSSTDRRHWLVCLAEFSSQEALAAIGQYPHPNRYMLI